MFRVVGFSVVALLFLLLFNWLCVPRPSQVVSLNGSISSTILATLDLIGKFNVACLSSQHSMLQDHQIPPLRGSGSRLEHHLLEKAKHLMCVKAKKAGHLWLADQALVGQLEQQTLSKRKWQNVTLT